MLNNMKILRSNIKEWSGAFIDKLNLTVHNLNKRLMILKNTIDEKHSRGKNHSISDGSSLVQDNASLYSNSMKC